jgi:hypothetical protein
LANEKEGFVLETKGHKKKRPDWLRALFEKEL